MYSYILLPPANEVWGKVIFQRRLSVHGGGGVSLTETPRTETPIR